nr:glycoside hydrolase family 88 protein [Oceanobacillus profundus]
MSTKRYVKLLIKSTLKRKNLINNDKFFWPNGLLAISLEWSYRNNKNKENLFSLKKYYNKWIKKGTLLRNTDYAINGYSLIYLYNITKSKKYLKAIQLLIDYLKNQKRTEIGSIPYRVNNPNQVFVDSLGMICPFLCRYGKTFNDDTSIDLAINQLTNFLKYGMDKKSYLPYHGYDSHNNIKLGIIGWGRANGWLLIGLVDSLEFIPKSHNKYQYLCDEFNNIVSNIIKHQREDGNFAWQITAKEGHIDTSSTSMICYAIRRGIMLGILPKSYLENTNLALDTLHKNIVDGSVQNCSAECRGLGMYPQKYSSYPWAQGPTTSLTAISIEY